MSTLSERMLIRQGLRFSPVARYNSYFDNRIEKSGRARSGARIALLQSRLPFPMVLLNCALRLQRSSRNLASVI